MTRIIGGSAGGRPLRTPPGDRTRPTSDRVREALFSSIESAFGSMHGLRVLDIYAGSGAVGLEALSRGAEAATLIEAHAPTSRLIEGNARALGFDAEVLRGRAATVLTTPPRAAYDVVFCDPPYDLRGELDADLALLAGNGWLLHDGLLVVERSRRSPEPAWPPGWEPARRRAYGETVLWYVHAAPSKNQE